MARAFLLLAALLLAVPGLFVAAKGLAAMRTGSAVVRGRVVTGPKALGAGLILLGWSAFAIFLGVVLMVVLLRR